MVKYDDPSGFSKHGFWEKMHWLVSCSSRNLIEKAMILYVLLLDENTPLWAKTSIMAALAYLICPLDAIPDFIPGAGLTDDLAALTTLLALLDVYVTPAIRAKARVMTDKLFKC